MTQIQADRFGGGRLPIGPGFDFFIIDDRKTE